MAANSLVEFEKTKCYAISEKEAGCIYKEIFEDGIYDINLPAKPFVIDVGANIGLFSIFIKSQYPSAEILAFEPAPATYNVLSRNVDLHNLKQVAIFEYGLSSQPGQAKLTYFPNLPGNSTIRPHEKQMLYEQAVAKHGQAVADGYFGASQEIPIKLERLSHFLQNRAGLSAIDLLKVDVEGAELEVLRGLSDVHWDMIRNVLVETWEKSGDREEIEKLLTEKGFRVDLPVVPGVSDGFHMIRATKGP